MDKGLGYATSRKVMEKKFVISDGSQGFVQANTLLEPGNNSAANQNEQDEIAEVSMQLRVIKNKHDETKQKVKQKEKELEQLQKDIAQVSVQEQQAEGPVYEVNSRLEQLNAALEDCRAKIAEETMCQHSYSHMLSRMKKDFIASKIKCTDLDESLKSKRQLLVFEESKQRKTKEERLQSKAIFDNLMKNIEKEQKDRQERILELNRCITNKEASVNRRIERQRKNQEIAETAASENKDSSELKDRQKLMINKLWNTFMRKKMEKEMRNSQQIDEAFKQIKTATSITDVDALVKRFLQRETTYSQLLNTVNESDVKIEKLKNTHIELHFRLHQLQSDSGAVLDDKDKSEEPEDPEIQELRAEITEHSLQLGKLNDRLKKINIVNDQVKTWCRRICSKLGVLYEDARMYDQYFQQDMTQDEKEKRDSDVLSQFQTIEKIVTKELTDNREYTEVWKKFIEAANTGNRFSGKGDKEAESHYFNINTRIRPESSKSRGDMDGRMSNISKGAIGDASMDDGEEAFNRNAILDLTEQRSRIIERQHKLEEELRLKRLAEQREKDKK